MVYLIILKLKQTQIQEDKANVLTNKNYILSNMFELISSLVGEWCAFHKFVGLILPFYVIFH